MALLQETKKLLGPLLDDLDCVSAKKKGDGVAGRGLHEGARRGGTCYHHTDTFSQGKDILKAKRASLADETFEMLMFMIGNKHHITIFCEFF
jgi:hypothetical protein